MPTTATVVNIGFFGAVTIGPLVGGAVAFGDVWRWLYAGLAAIAACTFLLALFTLPDQDAFNPGMPFDTAAILLAFFATVLPFWAAGELTGHGFSSYRFMIPLAVGFACFVALLLTQYHKKEPLSPVELLWHTYPLLGTVAAMVGGGAFIAFTLLIQGYKTEILGLSPLQTGLAFWPQVIGVLVTAVLLGALLRTRVLPVLTLFGMLLLIASGGVLLFAFGPMGSDKLLLGVIGMLGLGAGATVSPGLFMAAMSLPSQIVGRTLALVELVRSEADFIMAPVMLQVARLESGGHGLTQAGIRQAILITAMITGATTLLGILLYLGSAGARLPKPDLVSWLGHPRPAFDSPAVWAVLRRKGARE